MPTRSLRRCTYPGCLTLVNYGRCDVHSSKRIVRDPKIKKLYNSPQWRALRASQLAKEPWCADCMERGSYVPATEVDHVTPHNGNPILFFDPGNLQSLCKTDHSKKTASEVWRV